jgi:DNA invertase Pin-like site-specific DNA recombinase
VVDKCSNRIAFQDREFGKNIIRLGLSGEIDTLLVNSIDSLGKNGLDILKTIKKLIHLDVNIKSEKEGLQTINTDGSKNNSIIIMINIMNSIYEHEEKTKLEKQKQGIFLAKSRGVYKKNGGNKPKLNYTDFINKEKKQKLSHGAKKRKKYS